MMAKPYPQKLAEAEAISVDARRAADRNRAAIEEFMSEALAVIARRKRRQEEDDDAPAD